MALNPQEATARTLSSQVGLASLTLAWVRAAFFTWSWDCRSLKFLDQPSVLESLVSTPRSSYRDIFSGQCWKWIGVKECKNVVKISNLPMLKYAVDWNFRGRKYLMRSPHPGTFSDRSQDTWYHRSVPFLIPTCYFQNKPLAWSFLYVRSCDQVIQEWNHSAIQNEWRGKFQSQGILNYTYSFKKFYFVSEVEALQKHLLPGDLAQLTTFSARLGGGGWRGSYLFINKNFIICLQIRGKTQKWSHRCDRKVEG